jgi:hypothetical protein
LHRQPRVDIAVANLIDLQHFSVLPDYRHRAGEQAGIAGITDGRLIALETHRFRLMTPESRSHYGTAVTVPLRPVARAASSPDWV